MLFTTKKIYCAKCIHDRADNAVISSVSNRRAVTQGSTVLSDLCAYANNVAWMTESWGGRAAGEVFLHHSCVVALSSARCHEARAAATAAAVAAAAADSAAALGRAAAEAAGVAALHMICTQFNIFFKLFFIFLHFSFSCARVANGGAHDGCKSHWAPSHGS